MVGWEAQQRAVLAAGASSNRHYVVQYASLNIWLANSPKYPFHGLRSDFFFSGAKNVINNPEFNSAEKVGRILELLDRKDVLLRVLSENNSEGVSIVIGDENSEELMKNCSVIMTTYTIEGALGTLGVIGPTRMQYAKIISLVQFMSDTLNYLISKKN